MNDRLPVSPIPNIIGKDRNTERGNLTQGARKRPEPSLRKKKTTRREKLGRRATGPELEKKKEGALEKVAASQITWKEKSDEDERRVA